MPTIYSYDFDGVYDGSSRQITDAEGAPIGWTFSPPPEIPAGKFAAFVGPGWIIVDERPVNNSPTTPPVASTDTPASPSEPVVI